MKIFYKIVENGKEKGFVYLLGDAGKEGVFKIGVTTGTIERRIKKLQTGNSGEIYLIDYYHTDHPFFIESRLHQKFANRNVMNEWYELDAEDIINFKKYCDDVEIMIKSMKDNPFFPKNLK